MGIKAMILAAGEGRRLRPVTLKTPKPLIPIAGEPMLRRWFDRLASMQVKHIVVNCCHLAHQFDAIDQLAAPGQKITLITEPQALDTAGAVRNALQLFDAMPFFLISADVWFNLDSQHWLEMLEYVQKAKPLMHLGLTPTKADCVGDFHWVDGKVIKQPGPRPYQYAGFSIVKADAFACLEQGRPVGLGNLIQALAQQAKVSAEIIIGPHWDMGTPEGFYALEQSFLSSEGKY